MINTLKFLFFAQFLHHCLSLTTMMKGRMTKCLYKEIQADEELKFSFIVSSSDQASVSVLLGGPENKVLLDTSNNPELNMYSDKVTVEGKNNKFQYNLLIIICLGEYKLCFTSKSDDVDNYVTFEFTTNSEIGISQTFAKDEMFKEMNTDVSKLTQLTDEIFVNSQAYMQRQSVHIACKNKTY